ncbi:MAG: hypothetical protein QM757_28205 [Paludibaculum sp.]
MRGLTFAPPTDGVYRVEWHDAQFRGAAPGRYRLTIGDHVDVPVEYPLLQQGLGGDHQAVEKQTVAKFGRDVPGIRNLRNVPLDLNGVLVEPGEEYRWLVDVEPGKTIRFELIAARAGSPLDGVLTLYDQRGKNQLAMSDDQAKTSDGAIEYAVPKYIRRCHPSRQGSLGTRRSSVHLPCHRHRR